MTAQKEEEDRKANHAGLVAAKEEIATLTATIETKVTRQGDLAIEVESLKIDVADTQRDADQELAAKLAESRSSQSSEWKERQESSPGEGAPGESHTSRKTHALFTSVNLGMLLVACIRDVLRQGCHVIHMVLCTRRSTRCGVVFLLSHDLSQVGSGINLTIQRLNCRFQNIIN